jgi:ketosteroid isomerase-like protein
MLSVLLALAAQAVSGKLPPAPPVPPPSGAEQVVLGQIEQLFAAFQAGDSAAILRLVHSDGRVTGNGTLSSRTGLRQESWAQFAGRAKPGEGFQETITDPAIEVDGDIAMVWAPFVVRVNGKVSNCGFDHFDLVRENGAWKVMNLTFSSRITGCPPE